MLMLTGACVAVLATTTEDRKISDLTPGESVEIRFESQGCFHFIDAKITITRTEHFTATVERSTAPHNYFEGLRLYDTWEPHPTPIVLTTEDIAALDELLTFYRSLTEPGVCTTEDSISFLWRGPTLKPYIEPFVDATCRAPTSGSALVLRLIESTGNLETEPSNNISKLTVCPVTSRACARAEPGQPAA